MFSVHNAIRTMACFLFLVSTFSIAPAFSDAIFSANGQSDFQPDQNRLRAHIEFLADDLLKGRGAGSAEFEITARYIASQFTQYGLEPAGTDGYLQPIEFRVAKLDLDSPRLTLETAEGSRQLTFKEDFVVSASRAQTETNFVCQEVVFVGFGIVAESLDYDDYGDVDVSGKCVAAFRGKPGDFPGEEGAHFASLKSRNAAVRGAVGYISLLTPHSIESTPWELRSHSLGKSRMTFVEPDGTLFKEFPPLQSSVTVHEDVARELFEVAGQSLDDLYQMIEDDERFSPFSIPVAFELSLRSTHSTLTSPNIAAILPGSDPELRNEFVVLTAHADHLHPDIPTDAETKDQADEVDLINNGAMDNASGVSVLLETARLFSQLKERPKRSIVFLAVTAEEEGLLGSEYFAHNPTVPIDSIVASLNLDMPLLTFDFADIVAFGASHSDLGATVDEAASAVDVELTPDPWPDENLFTRSDHYSLVKQGIPSVFIWSGVKSRDPDFDASTAMDDFLKTHYHKPSDDMNLPFNWDAAVRFTTVNAEVARTVANQPERPTWNDGDFFGDTFGRKPVAESKP